MIIEHVSDTGHETMFLPPVVFGYVYTEFDSVSFESSRLGIDSLVIGEFWLIFLTLTSLISASVCHTILRKDDYILAFDDMKKYQLKIIQLLIWYNIWIISVTYPAILLMNIDSGNVISNSLLFLNIVLVLNSISGSVLTWVSGHDFTNGILD